jgi:hypothetical protein
LKQNKIEENVKTDSAANSGKLPIERKFSSDNQHNKSYLFAINLDDKRKNIDEKLKEAKYLKDLSDIEYVLETTDDEEYLPKSPISHIIIDCSPFNYVDSVGIQGLVHVNK